MTLRPVAESDLRMMEGVAEDYRRMWRSLRPPFQCQFSGQREDVDALDFVGYEAGHHPHGLHGASIVWGRVFAHTGLLRWLVGDGNQYFLGSIDYPRLLIWPYARTLEIENTMHPQFNKYNWLMQQAVASCLAQAEFTDAEEEVLVGLAVPMEGEGFSYSMRHAIGLMENRAKKATTGCTRRSFEK